MYIQQGRKGGVERGALRRRISAPERRADRKEEGRKKEKGKEAGDEEQFGTEGEACEAAYPGGREEDDDVVYIVMKQQRKETKKWFLRPRVRDSGTKNISSVECEFVIRKLVCAADLLFAWLSFQRSLLYLPGSTPIRYSSHLHASLECVSSRLALFIRLV